MHKILLILTIFLITSATTFAQHKTFSKCPELSISGPNKNAIADGGIATFALLMTKKFSSKKLQYNWTVDNGTIVSGQGTKSIDVDTKDLSGQTITASLTVNGLDASCENSKSLTIQVVQIPQ